MPPVRFAGMAEDPEPHRNTAPNISYESDPTDGLCNKVGLRSPTARVGEGQGAEAGSPDRTRRYRTR